MRLLVSMLSACVLAACKPAEEAKAPPVRPVLTVVAKQREAVVFGPFAGTVEPRYQSQLGFQIAGRMVARDVTVGDLVRKGQRLAALDPVVPRFELARAEADLADTKAQTENAAASESRTRRLTQGNVVAQAQLDQATANRDTAQARLAQSEAGLQKARDNLGYTELKADFDGVVTQRIAEIGQVLSAGQAVVAVARPDIREAVVDIPEQLVGALPADGVFTVVLQSAPGVTAKGRIRETAPFAEAGTRTRRLKIALDGPGESFRLGATITVSLSRAVAPHVLLPATALWEADGRRSIWIVTANAGGTGPAVVARRDVTVGSVPEGEGSDRIAVRSGLQPGERVVTAGARSLREGQAVRLEVAH